MTTRTLYNKISSLNIAQVAASAIEETKEIHSDLNVEQMMAGKRKDGSNISPSYSNLTIEIKKLKGQPTDVVQLKDTGDYHSSITTTVDKAAGKVITGASDPKAAKLEKKYSTKRASLYGLSVPYKTEYLKDLKPAAMDKVRKALK